MINDEEIYGLYQKNKEQGFRMLMDAYQKSLYFFIRRMVVVHADAEDVMQEVFVRVFRNLSSFRRDCSLKTWIYKIATNECVRFLHHQNESEVALEEGLASELLTTEYVDYENELAVNFQKAILSLPEKQRVVFNLRYYDELEYAEISRITSIKVENLKVDYYYAKEKIKKYMMNE